MHFGALAWRQQIFLPLMTKSQYYNKAYGYFMNKLNSQSDKKPLKKSDNEFVLIEFRLDIQAQKIVVMGSWDNWTEPIELKKDNSGFSALMKLPKQRYEYKYIVDDDWMCDPSKPVTSDHLNNVFVV
jgi:hypothetical protein